MGVPSEGDMQDLHRIEDRAPASDAVLALDPQPAASGGEPTPVPATIAATGSKKGGTDLNKLQLGRIVHYVEGGHYVEGEYCAPAIATVASYGTDGRTDLLLFHVTGVLPRPSVPRSAEGAIATWHWPNECSKA